MPDIIGYMLDIEASIHITNAQTLNITAYA